MRRFLFLTALVAAACNRPNPERPRTLVGTWQYENSSRDYRKTLHLAEDGTAWEEEAHNYRPRDAASDSALLKAVRAEYRASFHEAMRNRADTTRFTAWRVATDSITHMTRLCLERPGVGNVNCQLIRADSAQVALGFDRPDIYARVQ